MKILYVTLCAASLALSTSSALAQSEHLYGGTRCFDAGCTTELSRGTGASRQLNTRYYDGYTVYRSMQDGTFDTLPPPREETNSFRTTPETYTNTTPNSFDSPGTLRDGWKRRYGQ